jgi:hypothetical protein
LESLLCHGILELNKGLTPLFERFFILSGPRGFQ